MRVLQVNIDNKNKGGAYILIHNMDMCLSEDVSFDYLSMDEFIENGEIKGKTYSAHLRNNRLLGHFMLPAYVNKVLKQNKYDVMHINSDSSWKAVLYALPAKKNNVKVLVHSHSTGSDGSFKLLKDVLHYLCRPFINSLADMCIACSPEAGKWMFSREKFTVLHNGISPEKFVYSAARRQKMREQLGYTRNDFVVGNVGLISKTKNQEFLLDVLASLKKKRNNAKLLLVGSYEEKTYRQLKHKAIKLGVLENVQFTGAMSDIPSILAAIDWFAFPSLFEGLGISLIEAQAMGASCVVSENITHEAYISNYITCCPLEAGAAKWADVIDNGSINPDRGQAAQELYTHNYTIKGCATELEKIYQQMEKGNL